MRKAALMEKRSVLLRMSVHACGELRMSSHTAFPAFQHGGATRKLHLKELPGLPTWRRSFAWTRASLLRFKLPPCC